MNAARATVRWSCSASVCASLALLVPLAPPRYSAALQATALQTTPADLVFDLNPQDTKVNFTLGATIHTVHGTFQALRGRVEYTRAGGTLRGEFVVDAPSGVSGNASRDKDMHEKVLESAKYPAIAFRPDRLEGTLVPTGESNLQVHGIFSVHGAEHELTVPARLQIDGNRWTASVKFGLPYVEWGMKNPSTFLLRVSKTVDIGIEAKGTVTPAAH